MKESEHFPVPFCIYLRVIKAGGSGMEYNHEDTYDLYRDIQLRTGGEIYLGIVGPVRTGKSTFIKRFMDLLVLPGIKSEAEKTRCMDELPQSASGKTITTTEPKFIPKEAATISLKGEIEAKVRLVDCVGYMVHGATGHMEENQERMVKTPWYAEAIPFTKAAEIGTKKVIKDHSTLGIVITTDGSIGELDRDNYLEAEERTIEELHSLKKPFVVVLNTVNPYKEETKQLAEAMTRKYKVSVLPMNCMQMKKEDILRIMNEALEEFPIVNIDFFMPKWVEQIENSHPLKQELIMKIKEYMVNVNRMRDLKNYENGIMSDYITKCICTGMDLSSGKVSFLIEVDERYYFEMISQLTGQEIYCQYQLMELLKEYGIKKAEYEQVLEAMNQVRDQGYAVVMPGKEDISIEEPVLMRHGNKYGVKIKSESPSIHLIKANIISEIAPIVGTQQQAMDLIEYIKEVKTSGKGIWSANIFGKTVEQLIQEGIDGKIQGIGKESRQNLRDSMQKILNDSNGGMIFIII